MQKITLTIKIEMFPLKNYQKLALAQKVGPKIKWSRPVEAIVEEINQMHPQNVPLKIFIMTSIQEKNQIHLRQ